MAELPEVMRETASALSRLSAVDAVAALGCSRRTINRRKHQMRDALMEAGITSDFAANTRRQLGNYSSHDADD
jgi:hypothetical protein